MRLTSFLTVIATAIFTLTLLGCSNPSTDDVYLTSNVDGMRGTVYSSPGAQYPRVCFAYSVSGQYYTDTSCKLSFAYTASQAVQFHCPWPTTSATRWSIFVYNDTNKDNKFQINELMGVARIYLQRGLSGKFEIVNSATNEVTCRDATTIVGNATYINLTFNPEQRDLTVKIVE